MLRNALLIAFFGLMVAGCATDRKTETMESSGGTSSTIDSSSTASSEAAMSSQTMVPTTPADSNATIRSGSSKNRIAAGIEEETLDSCLQRIPQDATAGQKMLAEQTCRRDFPSRR